MKRICRERFDSFPGVAKGIVVLVLCCLAILFVDSAQTQTTSSLSGGQDQERVLGEFFDLVFLAPTDSFARTIEPVISRARAAKDSTYLTGLLFQRGVNAVSFGHPREGAIALREVLSLATATDDRAVYRRGLRWLCLAIGNLGRRAEARVRTEELLTLSREAGDREHEGWALIGLGWLSRLEGHSESTVRNYQSASEIFAEIDDLRGEMWALNGLGNGLSQRGEYRAAAECFRQVVSLAEAAEAPTIQSMALNDLGTLEYALGDPGAAMDYFRRAKENFEARGERQQGVVAGSNVALCLTSLGRHGEAAEILESLIARCEEENYREEMGIALNQLGFLRRRQGRHAESMPLYRRTLDLDDATSMATRFTAMVGLSRALAGIDSSERALEVLDLADSFLKERGDRAERYRHRLEGQYGAQLVEVERYEEALVHLRRSAQLEGRLGLSVYRVESMALLARAYRGLGLRDSVRALLLRATAIWEEERDLPLDPEWREIRGSYGRKIYSDLALHILEDSARAPLNERVREAFDRLQRFKARTLLERMLGPGSPIEKVPGRSGTDAIDLRALQQEVLEEGELLLDAYVGDHGSILFAVTRTDARALVLPAKEELRPRVSLYHQLLATAPRFSETESECASISEAGSVLGRFLFTGIEDLLGQSKRILFAPDGMLNLLPIGELPILASTAGRRSKLIEAASVVRIPSATVLASIRRQNVPPVEGKFAPSGLLAIAGSRNSLGRALPGARKEVETLLRRYRNVTAELDPSSDSTGLDTERLEGFALLHIASHAQVDDESPWQSRIFLDPRRDTGSLRAAQIAGLRLSARLAVLSSCESARGRIVSGEGVLGLSSALLAAGVPAVVATLWPVDDHRTAEFMKIFYEELLVSSTVAGALRKAQIRTAEDSRTAHPFYWAGFVLVGDGTVEVPLERRWGGGDLVRLGGLFLLGLALVLVVARGLRLARKSGR